MHRDYHIAGARVMVQIFPQKVEMSNPGGLPPGLNPDEFGKKSLHRNRLVADLFHRAGLVERIGSGVRRMQESMRAAGLREPAFNLLSFFAATFTRPKQMDQAQVRPKSGPSQAQVELSELETAILRACVKESLSSSAIAKSIGHKTLAGADKKAFHKLLERGYLDRTLPGKPRSRLQRYLATEKGVGYVRKRQKGKAM
jgi:ATP-dependent DNA helicase RecG